MQRKPPRRQLDPVGQAASTGPSLESPDTTGAASDAGGPVAIRAYRTGDEAGILRCFARVFPDAHRSPADWNWQFRDNPAGLRSFVGVRPDGSIVSQFAGIPRRVQVGERERSFSEIVDSFADPGLRAGLKRPGVFARTAFRYIEHFCRPDCETFAYGLPTPEAYRLGHRLLGYEHLWNVEVLLRDAALVPAAAGRVETLASFPADTNDLWARVQKLHDVAVVRDHEYLTWRYVLRPGVAYRRYSYRDAGGALVGIVVLRDAWLAGDFHAPVTGVADWIVDRAHPLGSDLFGIVAALGADGGAEKVALMFNPASPEWRVAIASGYRPLPTKFRFVGRTYDPENLPLERAAARWFVTLGDFDVI